MGNLKRIGEGITDIKLYRYEKKVTQYTIFKFCNKVDLILKTFFVVKVTPKGFWFIDEDYKYGNKRWVSNNATKRYAYPTEEEALNNYIHRTVKYVSILTMNLADTKFALKLAEEIKENKKTLQLK